MATRVDVIDHFIKDRFPEFFAGEAGTINDPDLKPMAIDFKAKPQEFSERDSDGNVAWYRMVNGAKVKVGDGEG
ncbi:MAG: hypothetical protein KGJ13_05450 [Patescibacteria group bacterium]|nr:hypothetical protein [Patescibacteria group bacterium]